MRNKNKSQNIFPLSLYWLPLPLFVSEGLGMGVVFPLIPPHSFPLLQHWGSTHRRQTSLNFSKWVFTDFTNLCPRGSQVLVAPCSSAGFPWDHRPFQGYSPVPVWGCPGAAGDLCSLWASMGCSRTGFLTMVFTMDCRGSLLQPWNPVPCVGGAVSPHSLTPLFGCCCSSFVCTRFINSSLCDPRGTTTNMDGLGFGEWWINPGASWCWLYWTWRKLPAASIEAKPCSL